MPLDALESRLIVSIAQRRDELIRDLSHWVAIPTGHNHTPGLDDQRGLITSRLARLGASTSLIPGQPRPDWLDEHARSEAGPIPPTALSSRPHASASRRLLLAGHIDTVHDPSGDFQRLTIDAASGRAAGPGCMDMKGGILAAIAALEALEDAGVPCSWSFLINSDEETGSFHSDQAFRAEAARGYDAGLIFEPALPDGSLVVKRPGSAQFLLETIGKSAHVGRDFAAGVSAVNQLARDILRADALMREHKDLIINIGPLRGGSASNIVPDRALAWGNVRFWEHSESEIQAIVRSLESPSTTVRFALGRPAKPMLPGVEQLALTARAAAEDLGQQLPFGSTGGVCDGNNLQSAGLRVIDTLGVLGGKAHTPQEFLLLDSLVSRAQLAAVLMKRLSTGEAS
jgi:glutamate carboxypeptidase